MSDDGGGWPASGVTFPARRGDDDIPLVEILVVLGHRLVDHEWTLDRAEFVPGSRFGEALDELATTGERVSTIRLIEIVADRVQLIDGAVVGSNGRVPDVVVESVRGDAWEVYSRSDSLLDELSIRFGGATRIPTADEAGDGLALLPEHLWPAGWSNPPELRWIAECELIDFFPWTFLHGRALVGLHRTIAAMYPDRTVVPVIKRGDNDDTACWEVGTGRILIIHIGADPGRELRGEFESFWPFFSSVLEEFVERAKEETEYLRRNR